MLWRRFVGGVWPLLVWAGSEEAADLTAAVHAAALGARVVTVAPFDPLDLECRPQLGGLVEFTQLQPGVTCSTCLSGYCPAHGTGVAELEP